MGITETNARDLYHYLKANPNQINTVESLASILGIDAKQVDAALRWVRDNCTWLGWTIPWVERGPDPKHYHVVETFGALEIRELLDGTNYEAIHARSAMQRRSLQAELCVNQCRTPGSRGHQRALALVQFINSADFELGMVETT
jgi:hypothetical protein